MNSILRAILERRRTTQMVDRIPAEIEIGELQARRLADELNDSDRLTFWVEATLRQPVTWLDILAPTTRICGLPVVGVKWPEHLSVRSEGASRVPEEHRLPLARGV